MSKLEIAMFSELIDCNSREVNLYLKDHYEKKMENKIEQAKKEVVKILTEDQPKGLNLSKEKIDMLASALVKNYLARKESA